MLCPKCSIELPEDSQFCNKCGAKIVSASELSGETSIKRNKSKIIALLVGVLLVVVLAFVLKNGPVRSFEAAISDNKYSEATEIYNEKIKGDTEKEKEVNELLKSEVEKIKDDYFNDKIQYSDAIARLETIQKTGLSNEVYSVISAVNNMNDSKTAFKKGKEYLDSKNFKEAMGEFKKVIKEDENYQEAQEYISSSTKDYKNSILSEAQEAASKKDFSKAISLINEALEFLPNDTDFLAKKVSYVQGIKNNQEVSVVNTGLFKDWIDDFHVTITVKNNTNKVVKKYVVGWMGYDKNNYPVKTGWLSPDYLKEGNAEANIQPGKSYGSDVGWQLTGGYSKTLEAVKFLACVKEVEYYDGSKWINPYYDLWVEEYKEKPLH